MAAKQSRLAAYQLLQIAVRNCFLTAMKNTQISFRRLSCGGLRHRILPRFPYSRP